ncbi:flagellar hook-associated protein 1 FlgK [Loktanella fryxellensis]|uniref:Flagellar hook-associated protein 1 n=1 Tax=Loktanella fryxellensis TaxID=245187 RepID=A0A1H7ZMZ9_9RHOB|nr:flagellar hook-associated protein FlgK [Loktanella fryxellensis]SEM59760.1 flagellar hook-associated protein 1 FlgK [Loktanella fryxellensis]
MSITQSLTNALSGLTANARMAETVSANLSNALTDGYGRRTVETSAQTVGGRSAGVRVDGIVRHTDRVLIGERRNADAGLARAETLGRALATVEASFSPADDPAGLGARLSAFETALTMAAADPASDQRLGLAVTRLTDVTTALSQTSRTVQSLRGQADAAIAQDVTALNAGLQQVQKLNVDIARMGQQGLDPSALMDQRQVAIDAISRIVPLREITQPNGKVALWTMGGAQLLDGRAAVIGFVATPTITAEMSFANGVIQGLTLNGVSAGPDGIGRLAGGSIGAAMDLRDRQLVSAQDGLDLIAAELITRMSSPLVDPTLTPAAAGLLTDDGSAYDPADIVGLARRIEINATVDPSQGGVASRLRDGVLAASPGPVGQTAQLLRFADSLTARSSIDPAAPAASAAGHIGRVADQFATLRLLADEAKSFAAARQDGLKAAELATGVDSDAELQMLLRIEQSYAANAKVMETIQSLIQRLMEI